jgi:hypothetical protein
MRLTQIRQRLNRFAERIDFIPRPILVKIVLVLVLAAAAAVLFLADKSLVHENKKMLKFIKNEETLRTHFNHLKENEALFAQYIVDLGKNPDQEKVKSLYITRLMDILKHNNLKVDSYRSEIEEKDGFVIFKYNITIMGKFMDVVRFFHRLPRNAVNIYVQRYEIRLHTEKMVRMGLLVEVVGAQL